MGAHPEDLAGTICDAGAWIGRRGSSNCGSLCEHSIGSSVYAYQLTDVHSYSAMLCEPVSAFPARIALMTCAICQAWCPIKGLHCWCAGNQQPGSSQICSAAGVGPPVQISRVQPSKELVRRCGLIAVSSALLMLVGVGCALLTTCHTHVADCRKVACHTRLKRCMWPLTLPSLLSAVQLRPWPGALRQC